jgi:hypothetical protein
MVFTHAKTVDADLVGQHRFVDDVAQNLRVRSVASRCVTCNVAKRVESEFDGQS